MLKSRNNKVPVDIDLSFHRTFYNTVQEDESILIFPLFYWDVTVFVFDSIIYNFIPYIVCCSNPKKVEYPFF